MDSFRTDESDQRGRDFNPAPTDVFIATYPKCGTTWVQQIVHSMRTGGDMDFGEITEVVPWVEMCLDLGQDPNAAQRGEPRAFKSHFHAGELPPGARYINVVRDPADVAISFYHFFEDWFFVPSSVSFPEFVQEFLLAGSRSGRFWDHVVAWWGKRESGDTLLLCYELMKADPEGAVRQIAKFIGYDGEEDRVRIAIEQSSFAFMSKHPTKYDDHFLRSFRNVPMGLPLESGNTKVRTNRAGLDQDGIDAGTRAALDAAWRETVTPATGFPNYLALVEEMRSLPSNKALHA